MRIIGYKEGFHYPVIDHLDRLEPLKIQGGSFLPNGDIALHCINGSEDIVCMIYPQPFPATLQEAMEQRSREIGRGASLFAPIASDRIRKRNEDNILRQENSVLWALELDPE